MGQSSELDRYNDLIILWLSTHHLGLYTWKWKIEFRYSIYITEYSNSNSISPVIPRNDYAIFLLCTFFPIRCVQLLRIADGLENGLALSSAKRLLRHPENCHFVFPGNIVLAFCIRLLNLLDSKFQPFFAKISR